MRGKELERNTDKVFGCEIRLGGGGGASILLLEFKYLSIKGMTHLLINHLLSELGHHSNFRVRVGRQ